MRVITVLLLLLCASALAGCVPTQGGYYDGGYYNRGGYYPGYGGGGYYGTDENAYERRRRRVEANCNMNWQNCAAICNQYADPNQRFACVANCNNALNQCKNR